MCLTEKILAQVGNMEAKATNNTKMSMVNKVSMVVEGA